MSDNPGDRFHYRTEGARVKTMTDLFVQRIPATDPRLKRQIVHDPRSRQFVRPGSVDQSSWVSKTIRVYDPIPNPNQVIGNCTGVAKCIEFNCVGDRDNGKVLKMADADRIYSLATQLDPWDGQWPPNDTGSSGLAAAKAAKQLGLGGDYFWLFDVNAVVQAVVEGDAVNVGTAWYNDMFNTDEQGVLHVGGSLAGGHEWTVRGYDKKKDQIIGRCWWGEFKDFRLARNDLGDLLSDNGDAHVQARL